MAHKLVEVTPQKASKLLGQSPAKLQRVKQGYAEMVRLGGRQGWLEWTGVKYTVQLLPKRW